MRIIRDIQEIKGKDITYYSEEELKNMRDIAVAKLLEATDAKTLKDESNKQKLAICFDKVRNFIVNSKTGSPIQGEHYHTPRRNEVFLLPETTYYVPPRTAEEAKRPVILSRELKWEIDNIFRD